eukprot:TRINITY_DN8988_c0_g1_i1.p1 TRINITY_DN8988_c0_g1~~TRINITY_DN8988_c0_g1_i1.p1  ORF type:complete len:239 (+),score=67.41 TRINITY_DN8988_c0_g1_i1:49-765(+)
MDSLPLDKSGPIFVVEHLEPEVGKWYELECKNMLKTVGADRLVFTNMKDDAFEKINTPDLVRTATPFSELNVPSEQVCLLDPRGEEAIKPEDLTTFRYFLFGGILGDHPPKDRTKVLRVLPVVARHLGDRQMSTDTAVIVTHKVLTSQTPLDKLEFQDDISLQIGEKDWTELPYRYMTKDDGSPSVAPGLVDLLRTQDGLDGSDVEDDYKVWGLPANKDDQVLNSLEDVTLEEKEVTE